MSEPHHFIRRLKRAPRNGPVFNPWWETDTENDIGPARRKSDGGNWQHISPADSAAQRSP
jgi:hypothetical protein